MEQDDNRGALSHASNQVSRAINDLAAPLTTIHGYAQLLQRRIRTRGVPSSDELLLSLGRIEHAARAMEMRLRQLEEDTSEQKR